MKKLVALCLIIISFSACKKEGHVPTDITKTIVLPANGSSVIDANNTFAFNFLHATLQKDNSNNNKLISPLSIYLALSMTYNGANNATKDSMAKTLQLSGINIDDLNAVCNALITQLPAEDNRVQLSIANSIWYNQNNFQPLTSFVNTVHNFYNADAQALNFNDASSVNTINHWVAQNTNNKITKVIEAISPNDLMYLINAIYFNGAWQYTFPISNTHNDAFHLQDGSTKTVQFMQQEISANFYRDGSFTLIELPYGGGKSCSMYIVLPADQQQNINAFVSSINKNVLENAISKADTAAVQISIPKWEYAYNIDDMRPELSMLGMGNAFTDAADFSNMYNAAQIKPFITKAVHKAYIKVNEEGTVAAAVTGIGVGTTSSEQIVFKVDHPFLYTIVEKQTGAILFTGVINNPGDN